MSERAVSEAMYNDIHEIKEKQGELKQEIVKISTDIGWMRAGIEELDKKLSNCPACKSSNIIFKEIENNKKETKKLFDNYNNIKYTSVGISIGISTLTALILLFLKIKEII